MGGAKEAYIEMLEDKARERKEGWIREELGDPDADETTKGWSELEDEYDEVLEQEALSREGDEFEMREGV